MLQTSEYTVVLRTIEAPSFARRASTCSETHTAYSQPASGVMFAPVDLSAICLADIRKTRAGDCSDQRRGLAASPLITILYNHFIWANSTPIHAYQF